MAAAEEQIASAQSSAIKDVRDQSVMIAVAAAREVIAKQMTAADGNTLIDKGIDEVEAKLH
jgi:F-type H+-transporting ATPase subunit b